MSLKYPHYSIYGVSISNFCRIDGKLRCNRALMVPGAAIRHMSCRRVGLTAIGARRYPQELYSIFLRFAA